MPIGRFTAYTFAGAFIWSTGLAYGGYRLGKHYEDLRTWMRPFDYPIAAIIVIAVLLYVYRHIKRAWWTGGPEAAP
jgi:membrane protein DedA with SNARE-associated domain